MRSSPNLAQNAAYETGGLCSRCHLLCSKHLKALTSPQGYTHYNSLEYSQSAAAGCKLCKTVQQSWIVEPRRSTTWHALRGGKEISKLPPDAAETHPLQSGVLDGLRVRESYISENDPGIKICDLLVYSSQGLYSLL